MSESQKETEVRLAFEGYEKRKFKEWKTLRDSIITNEQGQVTAEQKSFDEYVKTLENNATYAKYNGTHIFDFARLGRQINGSSGMTIPLKSITPSSGYKTGDFVILELLSSDSKKCYLVSNVKVDSVQITFAGNGKSSLILDGSSAGGGGGGQAPNITASVKNTTTLAPSQNATATVTKEGDNFAFSFGIPKGEKGEKGAGGGGAGGGSLKIPTTPNITVGNATKLGQFGCNLFDYRQLSQDRRWQVNGKTFSTNGEVQIPDQDFKRIRLFSGIKSRQLTLEGTSLEESNTAGKFVISYSGKDGVGRRIELPVNTRTVHETKHDTPAGYAYYDLFLGGDRQKGKYKIKVDAHYGDLNPNRLDRKFVFTEENGYKLISNGTQRNTYHYGSVFDEIDYQLGVCNLKDLKLIKVKPDLDNGKEILFEAPSDCYVQGGSDGLTPSTEFGKMMTNNLCELTEAEDDGTEQNKPFFVQNITQLTNEAVDGKKHNCFTILLDSKDKMKWADLLKDTQIIYPLKNELRGKKHVPFGGYTIRLSNGDYVESNKYANVSDDGDAYKFSQSPFGYRELRVAKHLIVSVDKAK